MRVRSGVLFTLIFLVFAGSFTSPTAAQEGDVCDKPNILSANCRFMGPYRAVIGVGQLRQGWSGFNAGSSNPDFGGVAHNAYGVENQGDQHIWTQGVPWTAGDYQVVNNTVPGTGDRAEIGWFVGGNKEHTMTRIGIDPTGGTDPRSPNIVWSPLLLTDKGHRAVQAVASNTSISIWAWASVVQANGDDQAMLAPSISYITPSSGPVLSPP